MAGEFEELDEDMGNMVTATGSREVQSGRKRLFEESRKKKGRSSGKKRTYEERLLEEMDDLYENPPE